MAESCSAQYLLNKFSKQQARAIKGFSDDAHDAIETYAWPGNVREMENKIKAGVIMAESKFVTAEDLGLAVAVSPPSLNLRVVRQNAETHAIRQALARSGGNISRTAELLGITRPTLYDVMSKYGIRTDNGEPQAGGRGPHEATPRRASRRRRRLSSNPRRCAERRRRHSRARCCAPLTGTFTP